MVKLISIVFFFLCSMKILLIHSFDITHRVEYNLAGVPSNDDQHVSFDIDSANDSAPATTERCIAVEATKELGCSLQSKTNLFNGIFKPICERHQLCYKCGFALNIPPWLCDQMANMQMYHECTKNLDSTETRYTCVRQRFVALKFLKQNHYQTSDAQPEFVFECQQECVADYFRVSK